MLKNNNPVFKKIRNADYAYSDSVATYKGVMLKTFIYLGMTVIGAISGLLLLGYNQTIFSIGLSLSGILTFVFGHIGMSSPKNSKVFGLLYCFVEGALIGFISMLFESLVSGVILATLVATFSVVLVVCTLYLSGIVKVNNKFAKFTLAFAISVIVSQLILFVFSLFMNVQFNFGLNLLASVIMIFLACLYLLMDLQQIVNIVESGMPKEYEWFASFGLVFTILWLYVEILPLILELFDN